MIRAFLAAACLVVPLAQGQPALAQSVDHVALQERSLAVLQAQFNDFTVSTAALSAAVQGFCTGGGDLTGVTDTLEQTWQAWAALDSYQFGPVEQTGAALRVNFWPDKKNFVGRGLTALLVLPETKQSDPAEIARQSAAVQGLPALERLLFSDLPPCPAAIGISANLQAVSHDLVDAWFAPDGWADLMRAAGPDNPIYLDHAEVTRTLFTAAEFGLARVADYRLGRPLGTYERNFPRRAEAWRSGLSSTIAAAQIAGVEALMRDGFGPALPAEDLQRYMSASETARNRLEQMDQPVSQAVTTPASRIRVEAVQSSVQALRRILTEQVGPALDVELGFSAADGD